jgi:hypothetical protein
MNRKPDDEVSAILGLIRTCQSMGCLPLAGGLLDQDSYFVFLLQVVLVCDMEREKIEQAKVKVK